MEVYTPEHYEMIKGWMDKRGQSIAPIKAFPRTGFVIPDVACGFVLCTGTSVCFFEFFYTNPDKPSIECGRAIQKLTETLLHASKQMGMEIVMTRVSKNGYRKHCKRYGFKDVGEFTSLVKEL